MTRIDIHGHYTSAPPQLDAFRGRQVGEINKPRPLPLKISDAEIDDSLEENLSTMDARGISAVLFSPRASGMGHDFGDARVSQYWTEANNDLIARVADRHPERFVGVAQLPQSPLSPPAEWVPELRRTVVELGFVGCNINPDISAGLQPFTPSLGDAFWYPLWEALIELDVPAMIHAGGTHNPAVHVNGAHYIACDYAAVVELTASDVFDRYPELRLIVPHGGGGIPFAVNRHRALHLGSGLRPFEEALRRLWFDTCVYDDDALEMLVRKVGSDRLLFGTEMFGTARGYDPQSGLGFDDVGRMLDASRQIDDADRTRIYRDNVLKVFPRLATVRPALFDDITAVRP